MPVIIDQNTIDIRITWLEIEKEKLMIRQAKSKDDEDLERLQKAIDKCDAKLEEMFDWLKILNQDPGWGDLINVEGRRIPKMPTFKDPETMKMRLEDPENWERGLTHEQTARAREYNAAGNARDAVQTIDGQGPISKLEEEGMSTEEAVEKLKEAEWARTSASSVKPQSNDDS